MTTNILEMRGITKTFPGVKALSNVTIGVERGEVHAICGENGAGKSTLMKVLSGVHPAGTYDGEIHFEGRPVEFHNIRDSEHAGIVIIHQELALIPEMSIAENIFLGNETASGGVINWLATRVKARELLARVGLEEEPDTKIRDIGVGKQQLVEIAKALSKDVKLLILDEPTRGIDVGAKYEIYTIINRLADEGKAILVISSELPELLGICDRIYALSAGRITGEVTRAEATQERLMLFMTHVQESA